MKIIIKFINVITIKLGLLTMLAFACFTNNIQAQKDIVDSKANQGLIHHKKKPGETDWQFLNRTQRYLGKGFSAATKNKGLLDLYRVYDEINKNKMQLAETFLENYPQDKHYDEVMRMLFYENFHPYFISEKISDSLMQYLNSMKGYKISLEERYNAMRALPIDELARAKYLNKTNDLVETILASNTSLERKYKAEFMLIYRDIITAYRLYGILPKNNEMEASYWNQFDFQFWDSFRWRMEILLNKYGELEQIATDIKGILDGIKKHSPNVIDAYWKYFFDLFGSNNPNADQAGIRVLHKFAADNVAAVEALKVLNTTEPLKMTFTAMDGTRVDLSKMRGKVVLIDFWTTWCGPCIKEMPHIQALYDKYRDIGFEVIGISGDGAGNKSRVQDILKRTGANWPQRLEGGGRYFRKFYFII